MAVLLLALLLLAGGPGCLAAQAGAALLEASDFQVTAAQPAVPGTRAQVAFTLRNISGQTLRLGSPQGIFLSVQLTLPGHGQPIQRAFGQQLAGGQLAPGQAHRFQETLLLDLKGSWTLRPACQLAGETVIFEQRAQTLAVGDGPPAKPAASQPASASPALVQETRRPAPSPPPPAPGPAGGTCQAGQVCVKALSYNLDSLTPGKNPDGWSQFMHILSREKPDLLVVQEAVAADLPQIARAAGLLHQAEVRAYGQEDWRGRVGIFSRWPLRVKSIPLPVSGGEKERLFGQAEVDLDGLPLAFYGMHLSRQGLVDSKLKGLAKELLGVGRRAEEMETVVKTLGQDPRRFKILAGDLNTFPLSGPYRLLEGQLLDAFTSAAPGTYRMDRMRTGDKAKVDRAYLDNLPNPKIDHVFHSQALRPLEARVIQDGDSDHYPVTATLRIDLADHGLAPPRIKAAQEALIKLGLLSGPAQGRLDPASRRALARWQAGKGLAVDGMLGPETLKLLLR